MKNPTGPGSAPIGAMTEKLQAIPVARLLKPASIAIVGISPNPASVGGRTLANLDNEGFAGEIHLVSRTNAEVAGRACVPTIEDLPKGVDTIVLALPQATIVDAVRAAARREAGAVLVFASGFAESGEEGKTAQAEMREAALGAGMALGGPNCMGLTNFVDRIPLTFGVAQHFGEARPGDGRGFAVVAQSGGMGGHIRAALETRGHAATYGITTGNEAALGVEDHLAYLLEDDATHAIVLLVEQFRKPHLFLELADRARELGKAILLVHPGRGERAKQAAVTHTGAMAGDYAVMRAFVTRRAVMLVDSLEEVIDATDLICTFPAPPVKGAAILTESGAFKSIAIDFCEDVGLDLPPLAPATLEKLTEALPGFASVENPLDITAQGIADPGLYGRAAGPLSRDSEVDSLFISLMPGTVEVGLDKGLAVIEAMAGSDKCILGNYMGDSTPLAPELVPAFRAAGIPFIRSPERAMRALAHITLCGRAREAAGNAPNPPQISPPPLPAPGVIAEHLGKAFLAEAGIPVPAGGLAGSMDEAGEIAAEIGYPVALKAQAGALAHKSDVGGVALGIADEPALARAWAEIRANLDRARPDLVLDGILVERMTEPGLEMVLGARRDDDWGPLVMVGLGGVWTEALGDFRLFPADLAEDLIFDELGQLKGWPVLQGARGTPPLDVAALVKAVVLIGGLIGALPQLTEVDINPLILHERGLCALDAVLVTEALKGDPS